MNTTDVKSYPKELVCENCCSELEYEESDLRVGAYGSAYVDCPVCGEENLMEDEHGVTLTADNIKFPEHFYHVSEATGAKNANYLINQQLRQYIDYFRRNKDVYDLGGRITGNLYLHLHKYRDDEYYQVTISNDFYVTEIPFEEADYE